MRKWKDPQFILEVIEIIKNSISKREVIFKLNLKKTGGNYSQLNKFITANNICIKHFLGMGFRSSYIENDARYKNQKPIEDLLKENTSKNYHERIKEYLIKNIFEYKCSSCGINKWLDTDITLELNHINGINNDYRLENLELLCPNCHSNTPKFGNYKNKACLFGSILDIKTIILSSKDESEIFQICKVKNNLINYANFYAYIAKNDIAYLNYQILDVENIKKFNSFLQFTSTEKRTCMRRLKLFALNNKLWLYKCQNCGLSSYKNKPLYLQCDHIDGNFTNNNFDNLQLLCHNCHSQTKNFAGKKLRGPEHVCQCGKKLRDKRYRMCAECYKHSKSENPELYFNTNGKTLYFVLKENDLSKVTDLLRCNSIRSAAKILGISHTSLNKYIKKYNININKRTNQYK